MFTNCCCLLGLLNQCWPYPPSAAAVSAAAFAARVQQHSNSPHSGHMVSHPLSSPGGGTALSGLNHHHHHHQASAFGGQHAHSQLHFRTLAGIFGPAAAAMFAASSGHMTGGVMNTNGLGGGGNPMSSTLGSYMAAAAAEWRLAAKAIQHNYSKLIGQEASGSSTLLPETVPIKGAIAIPAAPPAVVPPQPQSFLISKDQSDLNLTPANGAARALSGWNLKNAVNTFSVLNSKMNSTHISVPNVHLNHSNSSSSSSALSPPQHHMFNTGK